MIHNLLLMTGNPALRQTGPIILNEGRRKRKAKPVPRTGNCISMTTILVRMAKTNKDPMKAQSLLEYLVGQLNGA